MIYKVNQLFFILIAICIIMAFSCNASKRFESKSEVTAVDIENDTVSISSETVNYELIIIEPGFNAWLLGSARAEGYYDQQFLEARNQLFVREWNRRVIQPSNYDPNLYVLRIDYDSRTDYGYQLNYKLYNYFIYFQLKYNQQPTEFIPRI